MSPAQHQRLLLNGAEYNEEGDLAEDLPSVVDLFFSQRAMAECEICCQENGKQLSTLRFTYSYHMTPSLTCEAFCGYVSS